MRGGYSGNEANYLVRPRRTDSLSIQCDASAGESPGAREFSDPVDAQKVAEIATDAEAIIHCAKSRKFFPETRPQSPVIFWRRELAGLVGQPANLISDPPDSIEGRELSAESIEIAIRILADSDYEVKINGCRITGILNLQNTTTSSALIFENCRFDHGVLLRDITCRTLRFRNCFVPFISAERAKVNGSLSLPSSFVPLGVRASGAKISGAFLGYGATVCCVNTFLYTSYMNTVISEGKSTLSGRHLPDCDGNCLTDVDNNREYRLYDGIALAAILAAVSVSGQELPEMRRINFQPYRLIDFLVPDSLARCGAGEMANPLAEQKVYLEKLQNSAGNLVEKFIGHFLIDLLLDDYGDVFQLRSYLDRMQTNAIALSNANVGQDINLSLDYIKPDSQGADQKEISVATVRSQFPFADRMLSKMRRWLPSLKGRADNDQGTAPAVLKIEERPAFHAFGGLSAPRCEVRGDFNLSGAKLLSIWQDSKFNKVQALILDSSRIRGSLELDEVENATTFSAYGAVRALNADIDGAVECTGGIFHCFDLNFDSKSKCENGGKRSRLDLDRIKRQAGWKQYQALRFSQCKVGSTFYINAGESSIRNSGPAGVLKGHINLSDTTVARVKDDVKFYDPYSEGRKDFLNLVGFRYKGFYETDYTLGAPRVANSLFKGFFEILFRILAVGSIVAVIAILYIIFWQSGEFGLREQGIDVSDFLIASVPFWTMLFLFYVFIFGSWLSELYLSKFDRVKSGDALDRLDWLRMQQQWLQKHSKMKSSGFRSQPYEHLASVYDRMGERGYADSIRVAERIGQLHDEARHFKGLSSFLKRFTIIEILRIAGAISWFGFSAWRPFGFFAFVMVVSATILESGHSNHLIALHNDETRASLMDGSGIFLEDLVQGIENPDDRVSVEKNCHGVEPNEAGQLDYSYMSGAGIISSRCFNIMDRMFDLPYPRFHALKFSIDAALPFVDLGQEKYWLPTVNRPRDISSFQDLRWDQKVLFLYLNDWVVILKLIGAAVIALVGQTMATSFQKSSRGEV